MQRFHGKEDNPYPLPNDDEEVERLENLHKALRNILDGKNILAPISSEPTNILDVGCGPGQWCVEVANEFPSARVKGIDLSPVQPKCVSSNVDFIIADLNQGLHFDDGSQDLVHSRYNPTYNLFAYDVRLIRAGLTKDQWPGYMKEIFRILKPGNGWVQCGECSLLECDDGNIPEGIWKVRHIQ